jgi:CRP-like cAMP-binding protein
LAILRKKPKDRNSREILVLTRFLETTELITLFLKEGVDDSSVGTLLNGLSANIEVEHKGKNSNVFENKELGDKFYIILVGKVSVLKPIYRDQVMDMLAYYRHLIKLKEGNENFLLNTTIANNLQTYAVDDLDMIEEVIFKLLLRRKLNNLLKQFRIIHIHSYHYDCANDIADINKFFAEHKRSNRDYDLIIPESVYNQFDTAYALILEYYDQFMESNRKVFKFYSMLDTDAIENPEVAEETDGMTVRLCEYEELTILKEGQHFGDTALTRKGGLRNATIKTVQECYFATLTEHIFTTYVKQERDRVTAKDVTFLNELVFFHSIKKFRFERYYNDFVMSTLPLGHAILKEGDEPKELYIIKEGHVELKFKKSIVDLHNMVTDLKKLDPRFEPEKALNERFIKLKEFHKKKNFILFKLTYGKVIGLTEFIYQTGYFSEAIVSSDKAKLAILDARKMTFMMENEKYTNNDVRKFAFDKLTMLIDRLSNIKNTSIKIAIKENKSQTMVGIKTELLTPLADKIEVLHSRLEKQVKPEQPHHFRKEMSVMFNLSLNKNYTFLTDLDKHDKKQNQSGNVSMSHTGTPGIVVSKPQPEFEYIVRGSLERRPKTNLKTSKKSVMVEEVLVKRLESNIALSQVYKFNGKDVDIGLMSRPITRSHLSSPIPRTRAFPSISDFKSMTNLKRNRLSSALLEQSTMSKLTSVKKSQNQSLAQSIKLKKNICIN